MYLYSPNSETLCSITGQLSVDVDKRAVSRPKIIMKSFPESASSEKGEGHSFVT